jgi:hypothetical protein
MGTLTDPGRRNCPGKFLADFHFYSDGADNTRHIQLPMADGERIDGVRSVINQSSSIGDWRKSGAAPNPDANANADPIPDPIPDPNALSYSHSFTCHNSDPDTNTDTYADAGIDTSTNSDAKRTVLGEPEPHSSMSWCNERDDNTSVQFAELTGRSASQRAIYFRTTDLQRRGHGDGFGQSQHCDDLLSGAAQRIDQNDARICYR